MENQKVSKELFKPAKGGMKMIQGWSNGDGTFSYEELPSYTLDKIDKPMRGIVKLLNLHGFHTTSSCQGGEGHSFSLPTIVFCMEEDTDCEKLVAFLLSNEYEGFTISKSSQYQKSNLAFKKYATLEFWSNEKFAGK